jgi:hypothetical protein
LNSNSIEKNGMQISEKNIEDLLMNMVLILKKNVYEDPKRHIFMPLYLGMG